MIDLAQRLARLRSALAASEAEAILVSGQANIRYLSGFTGDYGALLIDRRNAILVSDFRFRYQALEQAPGCRFQEIRRWVEGVAAAMREMGYQRVAFEPAHLTYQLHSQLAAEVSGLRLMPADGMVERLRAVKDGKELQHIARAAAITDAAVERVVSLVRPGITERELALAAEDYIRKENGAELAFPPIVASGPRSVQCHAQPGPRQLGSGDLVVIDVGARWEGYGADITRTVAVSSASGTQRDTYALCYRAQAAGLDAVKAGMRCRDLDRAARSVIEDAGRGEDFGHGLGHGVGLEAHEAPRLTSTEEATLEAGMTTTVEPGIYTLDVGGVRLEDLVVVTDDGHRLLTHASKPAELPVLA